MKNYRKATAALILALIFCAPASAGEMHTDVAAPAPPPAANSVIQPEAVDSEMQTGDAASALEATDTLTGIALNLLQSVLSLV